MNNNNLASKKEINCYLNRKNSSNNVNSFEFSKRSGKEADALKELTGGQGVDVVYDPVGGDYAEQALRACGWGGRFLVIGFAAGAIPRIPLNLPLLKSNSIIGVFWGASVERDTATYRDNNRQIMAWIAEGVLNPHVDEIYSLDDTPKALDAIANRKVKGKVVVRP